MYQKQFTDPNPNGWANPSNQPAINASVMQAHTDAIKGIDNYLLNNTGDFLEMDVTEDLAITVQNHSHTYVVLHFGNTVYNVTFVKSDPSETGSSIVYHGGEPIFQPNSTYELSFLNLDCIYVKRGV